MRVLYLDTTSQPKVCEVSNLYWLVEQASWNTCIILSFKCLEIEEFDRAEASPLPAEEEASCSMSCSSFAVHQEGNCNCYYQNCCYNTAAQPTLCLSLPHHSPAGAGWCSCTYSSRATTCRLYIVVSHPKRQCMPSAKALKAKQSIQITY